MNPPSVSVSQSGQENSASMASKPETRAQPWKAHWPPPKGTHVENAYGFAKGEAIHIYGN
ncbi:hypothetical protein BU26DRAFT_517029 [Trematosphaeria pertusa]|uniref:Uncharacterized protein n=1 Tax=Trematosphaeria pertusa TaxID=390896 RepID=A0A6A6IQP2_9PLEO|nr:uncharacterized protein BU26DRAFT_517029 [Trematosphaeria pertusa]KAF2252388.1 hypothetical protein BU26DRAFT_517029 [Trematosphaeria pertusa]